MSFSVEDPYELISIADSLDTGAAQSTLMLLMYISQRFGQLGQAVGRFPSVPRDEFDSVVRDDFEPRLLAVGTDSVSAGESLIGMMTSLQEFHSQVPQVKTAAEPLANALINLYSVKIPSAPAASRPPSRTAVPPSSTAEAQAGPKAADSQSRSPRPGGAAPPQSPAPTRQQPKSDDAGSSSQGAGDGAGPSPSAAAQGLGGGSGDSPAAGASGGAPASPPAYSSNDSNKSKKFSDASAAFPDSAFSSPATTGPQSADRLPPAAGGGLGGSGAGPDPRTAGAAPGRAAAPPSNSGAPGAGMMGGVRGTGPMMGGVDGLRGHGFHGRPRRGGRGGEKERKAPDYLYSEDNGYELIEKLPVVSPDMIGALMPEEAEEMELHTGFAFSDPA